MTTPKIELIDFRLIDESEMNPRKSFDESSLKELSESISKQGLLQPITVRTYVGKSIMQPVSLQGKPCYEIICGARRYKAAVIAGLSDIPCIVREMTDEEAFDAMITENLQRKDVAPMDEARAFLTLHERNVSFEELAARFGKSTQFIRHRIKLNDLIPEFIEMLDKKELQVSHALEICKLDTDRQKELFKDRYENSDSYYSFKYKPLSQVMDVLSSTFKNLNNAKFDKGDCETCEFRCGSNALFAEYSENSCMKPECFADLTNNSRIEIALEKEKQGLYLVKRGDSIKEISDPLENTGSAFLDWNSVDVISKETMPDAGDYEYKEADPEYLEDCEQMKPIIEKQNAMFESGELKKVWLVGVFNEDCERIIKVSKDGVLNENAEQERQLEKLQSQDKRNAEIKGEKIIEELRVLMSSSSFYDTQETTISDLERVVMYAVMLRNCEHDYKRKFEKDFDSSLNYFENCKTLSSGQKMQIIRAFISRHVTNGDVTYSPECKVLLTSICKESFSDETIKIELKHEDTYLKRKERIDEQIKLLK